MKKFAALLLTYISFLSPVWADDLPISIEASVKNNNVELFDGEPPSAGKIEAVGKIKNMGTTDISLSMMTCSYYNDWKTDNKAIILEGWSCLSNYPHAVTIKPGEIKEVNVPLLITEDIPSGNIHFKLGFKGYRTNFDPKVLPHNLGREPLADTIWSQEIILHPLLPSEEKQKYWHAKAKWFEDLHKQDQMKPEKDGAYKRYYFSGTIYDERSYKNGKLDGPYKKYFENGQIESDLNYKEEKQDGRQKHYNEKGQLTQDELYSNGELVSYITYNRDGSIHGDMKFMKLENGHYIRLPIPCAENDSDREVLSMPFGRCNQ